ncbi:plasma-membrane proton-efflux P-type ATPase [Methylosinus sp. KRF6]|uniref:plasma-membrane proton-efflux P-type ATPase n=1 Tax=Methylosinus sp. KRF6 TaxID=2846853 RepID=UPI001C0CF274|nr:plasma-membrane proton-efflux P-type ATPase [Methylosinus sp. KRF6]MBU3887890.1 plasma-membrane proton-efflux P-type ATPase [Methylosinus sp. KRF6]
MAKDSKAIDSSASEDPRERAAQQKPGRGESADAFAELSAQEALAKLESAPEGLSAEEARRRLGVYGPNTLEEKRVPLWRRLLTYFWGPIPWMIEVAAVLSAVNEDWRSFGVILLMLFINGGVGFWQEKSAADALDALKGQLALKARVRRDNRWIEIDAADLAPGDVVRIQLGDITPADVKLLEGDYLSVDQSALTGESLPVTKNEGNIAYSSTAVKEGEMIAVVCATGANTFFGRTAKLVESAGAESHFQRAVLRIGNTLVISAIALSALLVVVEIYRGVALLQLLSFVLIVVVASIPVALPAVLSVTMALGALALSRMKAVVSRLEAIEEMAGVDVLCADKTGTLTQNKLTAGDPVIFEAQDAAELILAAALASKKENRDAIDDAVIAALPDAKALEPYRQTRFTPFDPKHKRTEAAVKAADETVFSVTKGAPQVIVEMCHLQEDALERANKAIDEAARKGFRTLGVARSDDNGASWRLLGVLPLYDPPRDDSEATLANARDHGIIVKMVTGDNTAIAREIARQVGLGTNIHPAAALLQGGNEDGGPRLARAIEEADGFAEVFPEHKFNIVKALQDKGHIVAMTGDGVNDAPALRQAEVGIAVSGATEAARDAASLVLIEAGLSVIVQAVEEARRIFARMTSYTIYRIAMTLSIMVFVVLTMIVYYDYPLTIIMIILLALLDDIPIMTIAWDNTELSPKPVRWQMDRLLIISVMFGTLALAQSFALFILARSVFGIGVAETQTMMFLRFIVGGHLLLLVSRTRRPFWRRPHPSWQLLSAVVATQIVGVLFVWFGWLMQPISLAAIGLIWAYDIVWMLAMDAVKLGAYHILDRRRERRPIREARRRSRPARAGGRPGRAAVPLHLVRVAPIQFADLAAGVAISGLTMIGLSGFASTVMAAVATVVLGLALLLRGRALLVDSARLASLPSAASVPADPFGVVSWLGVALIGGGGALLGALVLLGGPVTVLTPSAIIGFGVAFVLSGNSRSRLYALELAILAWAPVLFTGREILTRRMDQAFAKNQMLAGLAASLLGLIAVAGINAMTLSLVALLVLGLALASPQRIVSSAAEPRYEPDEGQGAVRGP